MKSAVFYIYRKYNNLFMLIQIDMFFMEHILK